MEFFMAMIPPTVTHQEHKVTVQNGKPIFYDTPELKAAKNLYIDTLYRYAPQKPFRNPVRLITKWIYPRNDDKNCVSWKTTKPDTDNMIKLLKDCMTMTGFWTDDALVVSEITEKFLGSVPGIWIHIDELDENDTTV